MCKIGDFWLREMLYPCFSKLERRGGRRGCRQPVQPGVDFSVLPLASGSCNQEETGKPRALSCLCKTSVILESDIRSRFKKSHGTATHDVLCQGQVSCGIPGKATCGIDPGTQYRNRAMLVGWTSPLGNYRRCEGHRRCQGVICECWVLAEPLGCSLCICSHVAWFNSAVKKLESRELHRPISGHLHVLGPNSVTL